MLACAQCSFLNTLDSHFCRRCGDGLPADAVEKKRIELEALVNDGGRLFEEGRIDDAGAIADEAVLVDPACANAHALKGMVHERRGEIARALESYERVVELNPSSALDRIKLSGLRQALAERAIASAPDRRVPILAGISAAVLVVCVGVAIAKLSGNPGVVTSSTPPIATTTNPLPAPTTVATTSDPSTTKSPTYALNPGDVPPVTHTSDLATTVPAESSNRGSLPRARRSYGMSEVPINPAPISGELPSGPVRSGGRPGSLPNPAGNPTSSGAGNTPPPRVSNSVDPPPTPATGETVPPVAAKPKGDGVIQIEVGRGSGKSGRPTTEAGGGGGSETLRRVGDASLQSGDYARAASSYERARRSGSDDPGVDQRLGQAYERMGKTTEAAAAYARSRAGFESRVKANPNDERAKNGLSSVEQALKVLNRG